MRPHYVIKGYPYGFHIGTPSSADTGFPLGYIWINTATDTAYMLFSINDGLAIWVAKEPDTTINNGSIGEVRIIGESYLGDVVRTPGGGAFFDTGWVLPPNVILSNPNPGEYKVADIKMDVSEKIVVTYEDTPQP
jgi:hypothetical protein